MKYLVLPFLLLLAALCPWICGNMSVKAAEGRFRNACEKIGVNERPFSVEKGYLSSSLYLNEPLSTTVSSLGLPKEAVDFFRDKDLVINCEIVHGPMHFYKGAEHTTVTVRGNDWSLTGEEWRTNRLNGVTERFARIYDNVLEVEGALFSVSNFWLREGKTEKELNASTLVVWPGAAISDLNYSQTTREDGGKTATLKLGVGRFGEETLKDLQLAVEKDSGYAPWRLEVLSGTWNDRDLKGKKLELNDSKKYNEFFETLLTGGEWLKGLLEGNE